MTTLSRRLEILANLVEPGRTVADIGSDHAALALYLAENNISPRVIVSELGDGPYNRASQAVEYSQFRSRISLRQGNGLQVLLPGEVDIIVLAGMGGDTIVEILSHDWPKSASYNRYLFQPMSKSSVLRQTLAEQGWLIEDEKLVKDNHRIFTVIAARPLQHSYQLTDLEQEIGPVILRTNDNLKREYLRQKLIKWRRIYDTMMAAGQPYLISLAEVYRDRIIQVEEILNGSDG